MVGRFIGVGETVAAAVAAGVGVPAGTSNRPRRWDTVGDCDAEASGDEVAALSGRIVDVGFGVIGAGVRAIDADGDAVDTAEVVAPSETAGAAPADEAGLMNFFDGAFDGAVASDFIFWRAFFASS